MLVCQFRKALLRRTSVKKPYPQVLQFSVASAISDCTPRSFFKPPIQEWTKSIGNTPVVEIEPGIHVKLEGYNPSGSYKDRSLTSIFMNNFESGALKSSDSTLCLITSGSAGRSLAMLCQSAARNTPKSQEFNLELNIIIPLSYANKSNPLSIVRLDGVRTFYGGYEEYFNYINKEKGRYSGTIVDNKGVSINVIFDDQDFKQTVERAKDIAAELDWVIADQHYDCSGMHAQGDIARELMVQIPNLTDVVCATGSGAAAGGLRKYLPDNVNVHSRPSISGTIEGLTDIRHYNNFCKSSTLVGYEEGYFPEEGSAQYAEKLLSEHGVSAGMSTGSCYWLAKKIVNNDKSSFRQLAFISADGTISQQRREAVVGTPLALGKPRFFNTLAQTLNNPFRGTHSTAGIAAKRQFSTRKISSDNKNYIDHIIIGGGPVGTATAWQLSEKISQIDDCSQSVMLIHEPNNHGAHEDWSRLARLSFDADQEELDLSKHALKLLDIVDEVRSFQSGPPVIPLKPGMLFLASPGTHLAKACMNAEATFNETDFIRRKPEDLSKVFPGNDFNLPENTLCWSHPKGYCVSPIELCSAQLRTAKAYGVDIKEGTASIDINQDMVKVSLNNGESYITKKCYVFAGAQNKEIFDRSIQRTAENHELMIPEFENTYITAISTVRYNHAKPQKSEDDVATPIILGQLEIPDVINFQANFSIVPEEYGDVLKTRLSGNIGTEVIPTVSKLHEVFGEAEDVEMKMIYESFFGKLFPFLDTSKPLDFNRCVTYRNYGEEFSGTSILEKKIGGEEEGASIMTTVGCFGVGVKFGPALGETAACHALGEKICEGMDVYQSGNEDLLALELDAAPRAY